MKKHFLSCLLMGALLASSCSDTDEAVLDSEIGNHAGNSTVPVTVPKVFQARFAEQVNGGTGTQKTYFDGASATPFQYNFASTDRVQFLSSGSDKSVIFTNKNASGTEASFSTDEEVPDGFADGKAFVAVMPPQANASCDYSEGNIIVYNVEIPSVQTAVKDSYDPNAHVFVSMSLGMPTEFSFYTFNSFLLIANESDIEFEKIVCVSNNGYFLAGSSDFDQDWEWHGPGNRRKSITLNGPILPKSNYFITILPSFMDDGYKLLGYCADGSIYEYKVVKEVEFVRNHIRGVKPKWEKYVPMLDSDRMISAIPYDEATSITFGKKSEYSDVSFTGDYVDEVGKFIGVYTSKSDPDAYYVLSENDGEIIAPEDCSGLFHGYSNLKTLSLNNFNTANVTNMFGMFYGCSGLTNLTLDDNFNTANVTNMHSMFSGCSGLTNLTLGDKFNTANVSDMGGMFSGCSGLTNLTLGDKFNTANVTDMSEMFYGCSNLKTIYATDKFTTNKVTESAKMFTGCTSLVGGMGTKYDELNTDATYAKIDGGASAPGYFSLKGSNLSIEKENDKNVDGWD